MASLGRIENVIGAPISRNLFKRVRLKPISSIIRASFEFFVVLSEAKAFEKQVRPKRLPVKKRDVFDKNILLSITILFSSMKTPFNNVQLDGLEALYYNLRLRSSKNTIYGIRVLKGLNLEGLRMER